MTKLSTYFTLFMTLLLFTACGAKSSGNSAASAAPPVANLSSSLVAAASSSSISTGQTVTFSVIGGTAPYTWIVTSGGGTLDSSTGASVLYTASNSAGLVYVSVTDSLGATTSVSVNVASTSSTSAYTCNGNYSGTLGSHAASFQFTTNGTALTGYMVYAGYKFALTGTCGASGVSFVLTSAGDTFTGTFGTPTGALAPISGTYLNAYTGTTQTWTATPL